MVLRRAQIIGATITRTYLRPNEFAAFDIVIIDEASMILLSMAFYASTGGDALRSVQPRQSSAEPPALPEPFAQRVIIADTSRVWPFAARDAFKSRFSLMLRARSAQFCSSPPPDWLPRHRRTPRHARLTAHRRNLSAPSLRLMKSTRLFGHALLMAFRVTSAAPW